MSPELDFHRQANPDKFHRVLDTKKIVILMGTTLLLITGFATYIGLRINSEENKDSSVPTPTPAEDFDPNLNSDFQTITTLDFKSLR